MVGHLDKSLLKVPLVHIGLLLPRHPGHLPLHVGEPEVGELPHPAPQLGHQEAEGEGGEASGEASQPHSSSSSLQTSGLSWRRLEDWREGQKSQFYLKFPAW